MPFYRTKELPATEMLPGVMRRAVYLDDVMLTFFDFEPDAVGRWEQELYAFVDEKHPEALRLVNEKKVLNDEVEGAFRKALDEFQTIFKA